jgi:hypothetical protein
MTALWQTCLFMLLFVEIAMAQQGIPTKFALSTPVGTQTVHIAGDFNEWSPVAHPLRYETAGNQWTTVIDLLPGTYQYRFIINGLNWIKDPVNPNWGGEKSNSIIHVTTQLSPVLKKLSPETGSRIRSVPFQIEAEYWDGLGKYGLDRNHSQIVVNGHSIPFEYFAPKRLIRAWSPHVTDGNVMIRIEAVDKNGNAAVPLQSLVCVTTTNTIPSVDAGYTIIAATNSDVSLNTAIIHDPDLDEIRKIEWRVLSAPAGNNAKLQNRGKATPILKPDVDGRYVVGIHVSDGVAESPEDSVDIYAMVQRSYPVEFQLADSAFRRVYEAPIDSAYIAGDFNNWASSAICMSDVDHDGIWTTWLTLDPGEYEYKYVVNGQHWIADPHNPAQAPDGWNGFNSIKTVTLNLTPEIEVRGLFQPGAVILDASKSYSKTGSELTFHWFQDISNPQRVRMDGTTQLRVQIPKTAGMYYFYVVVTDKFGSSARKTIGLQIAGRKVEIINYSDSPDWTADAIITEIDVRKFTTDRAIQSIISKLPALKHSGINCLILSPIVESPTTDGIAPSDWFQIDKKLGSNEDFATLITAAHEAGIRVIIDFIAGQTSDQHPYFVSAFQNYFGAYHDFYRWVNQQSVQPLFYRYEFHQDWDWLPNMNFDNPQVPATVLSVAEYWTRLGIDGFRCRNAWSVPHSFWKQFRRHIKKINPECLLVNDAAPRSRAYHDDEFDMSCDNDFHSTLIDVMNNRKPVSAIQFALRKSETNFPSSATMLRYWELQQTGQIINQFGAANTQIAATLLMTIPGTPLVPSGLKTEKSSSEEANTRLFNTLVSLRRDHSCIRRAPLQFIPTSQPDKLLAYIRMDRQDTLLVMINFSKQRVACQLLMRDIITSGNDLTLNELISNTLTPVSLDRDKRMSILIEGETAHIYRIGK